MNSKQLRLFGSGVSILVLSSLAMAGPSLENGDFSIPALAGWTVEYGDVTDGGGFALFQEDPASVSSTLSQQFTMPASAAALSFDLGGLVVPGGNYDPEAWPDAFCAYLCDPLTGDPLVSNIGGTEYFYLDNTGYLDTVASVSINVDTLTATLDVSALSGLDAYLRFDLWSREDGMQTIVGLDNVNVQVSVVPVPGALVLGLIGTSLLLGRKQR
jgi:hypothetical protein